MHCEAKEAALNNKGQRTQKGCGTVETKFEADQTEEVAWLWYPYLPRGKLTIIQGDPVVLADPSARL